MLYLLDANTLIRANADYYPIRRVPQFWDWLLIQAQNGSIKLPFEIFSEFAHTSDDLGKWVQQEHVQDLLLLEEEVDRTVFQRVVKEGYAADLNESDMEKIGCDPFLISYALMGTDRAVVTKEVSAPKRIRANRKIPDICQTLGVRCMNDFELYKILNFKTK